MTTGTINIQITAMVSSDDTMQGRTRDSIIEAVQGCLDRYAQDRQIPESANEPYHLMAGDIISILERSLYWGHELLNLADCPSLKGYEGKVSIRALQEYVDDPMLLIWDEKRRQRVVISLAALVQAVGEVLDGQGSNSGDSGTPGRTPVSSPGADAGGME